MIRQTVCINFHSANQHVCPLKRRRGFGLQALLRAHLESLRVDTACCESWPLGRSNHRKGDGNDISDPLRERSSRNRFNFLC